MKGPQPARFPPGLLSPPGLGPRPCPCLRDSLGTGEHTGESEQHCRCTGVGQLIEAEGLPRFPPATSPPRPASSTCTLPAARALGNASHEPPPTSGRVGPARLRAHRGAGSNLGRLAGTPPTSLPPSGRPSPQFRAALRSPAGTRVPPISGPWPSGVRPSRSRSACLGSGSCSAASPRSRRSGSRRLGRLGPANARGTRGPWRRLRLRPASDGAAGTAARSGRAAAWSRESHLPAGRRNPGSAKPRGAATGWGARAACGEPTGRTPSPMKSFGSIIHSSTGGTLCHLLTYRLLKT